MIGRLFNKKARPEEDKPELQEVSAALSQAAITPIATAHNEGTGVGGEEYKAPGVKMDKELAAYTSCMGDYDSKLAEYNSTATKQVVNGWTYTWHTEAQPKMNCYATGDVRHGFLWLPEYGVN